jgi:hypothetical protein
VGCLEEECFNSYINQKKFAKEIGAGAAAIEVEVIAIESLLFDRCS